jgi:hypothetical protein
MVKRPLESSAVSAGSGDEVVAGAKAKLLPAVMPDVPDGVVTVTSTLPVPGGVTTTICVSEITPNGVAFAEPKVTAVAPVRPVPTMVTLVPPAAGPEDGTMLETVGDAMIVFLSMS